MQFYDNFVDWDIINTEGFLFPFSYILTNRNTQFPFTSIINES